MRGQGCWGRGRCRLGLSFAVPEISNNPSEVEVAMFELADKVVLSSLPGGMLFWVVGKIGAAEMIPHKNHVC